MITEFSRSFQVVFEFSFQYVSKYIFQFHISGLAEAVLFELFEKAVSIGAFYQHTGIIAVRYIGTRQRKQLNHRFCISGRQCTDVVYCISTLNCGVS